MQRELIITEDGSHSLFVKEMGETFHSKHGAVQESAHVYIENGLALIEQQQINILEFGFGTGLNALLTVEYCESKNKIINYESIEAYPLSTKEYSLLNFNNFVNTAVSVQDLHDIPTGKKSIVTENFTLLKHECLIEDFEVKNKFDIIYFDVFGYDYQSELWSTEILQKAYDLLNDNGIFVTYACKGIVNRRLKDLGFKVYKKPGPPGKREMVHAVKNI